MQIFDYLIKDPVGLHARPAGLLVKKCKSYEGISITVSKNQNSADCRKLLAVMALAIKCGDRVTFTLSGPGEQEAAEALAAYCAENF